MTQYYVARAEGGLFSSKWAYADIAEPSRAGDGRRCPVCGGPVESLAWLPPHRSRLSTSKPDKWGDFVWGAGFLVLVSSRFRAVYEEEGLTGIATFHPPVEILRLGTKKASGFPGPLPVYHLIDIPWGGANQDDIASGVSYELPANVKCPYCRVGVACRRQPRVVIDESSWDGTDVFRPRGTPAPFVCSARFKQAVDDHGLTRITLIPAEKYGYDERRPGHWYVGA